LPAFGLFSVGEAVSRTEQAVLSRLPELVRRCAELRDRVISTLVMLGEIPAPTFSEHGRTAAFVQRLSGSGVAECATDGIGNAFGLLPGRDGKESIVIAAHADTPFSERFDHTISVTPERITGPAVADNSLGLAVVATLPDLLEEVGISLRCNLVLLGSVRSLGRGDIQGIRYFLENRKLPVRAGICVEGAQLGRLSVRALGMLRGEITCTVPEEYDWTRFGATGAILILNELINRIAAIRLPKRPRSAVVLGSVEGGTSYGVIATHGVLRFEVRSESGEIVEQVRRQIEEAVHEVAADTGADLRLNVFGRRHPGGLPYSHPLARIARKTMRALNVKPRVTPSTSELCAFIAQKIPALTIGITRAENISEPDETLYPEHIPAGLAQLLAILMAIDGGCGDETGNVD